MFCGFGGEPAGAHDVGERQQARDQLLRGGFRPSPAMERSVAVLPFENVSPNGRDFSSGSGGEPRSYVSAPKGQAQEDLQFSEMSSLERLKRYDD
jgi:hypothetical protein